MHNYMTEEQGINIIDPYLNEIHRNIKKQLPKLVVAELDSNDGEVITAALRFIFVNSKRLEENKEMILQEFLKVLKENKATTIDRYFTVALGVNVGSLTYDVCITLYFKSGK